ncbi:MULTISPECIES: peptidase domain-containing ABC transporter [unclassified Serratia (in: enterobacteria)]|uniref:peptidase domain-containing ABC transporter n=1 Tax=unclassified Serratia (in: enterobacteria) TaxID=2647522 RepID=UPI002ED1D395|nr:ATP-binding cassette domain-containing protein [Serratia sp. C2(2)]MEE4449118.1 ATP-binding cassette domain-containing protein [Serratia sp. C2(1)]
MGNIIPTPVFQSEINECGLACIAMLAETQGISAPLTELRDRYPASQHGTSLAALCEILSELAVPTYPVAFEHQDLAALPLPAILHYGAGHYVLLAYRQGDYVCVMNPALGQQLLPFNALKAEISGYALVLDRDSAPVATTNVKRSGRWHAFSSLSMKDTAAIAGIYRLAAMTFFISLTLFIMPVMVGNAVNQVFSTAGETNFPYFYYLLAFLVSTVLALAARMVIERFIKNFVLLHSAAGFSRLLDNSLNFFNKRAPGEIFSRFISWQMAAGQKIELDNSLRTDWIIGAIALAVMCYLSPMLALVPVAGMLLMGMVSIWAVYRDRHYTQQLQGKGAAQNDFILETIQGFSTIKSAGLAGQRQEGFAAHALSLFTCLQQQKVYEQVKGSIYQLIGSLEMVLFMLLALPLLKSGALSLGAFFAYSFIREIFTSYTSKIFFSVLHKNQLHVIDERARDLFPAIPTSEGRSTCQAKDFNARLRYSSLTFAYDAGQPVLRDMSLALTRGECVAITGGSGAGKSTLLKVISCLLTPQQGRLELDGQPIEGSAAQGLFFLQSQEDILFNASVLQNITLFAPSVPGQLVRVEQVLRGLGLAAAVAKLPGGVNALVRESHAGLSLGQRQRLLLARAMYSNNPVLVLDEPTANLDEDTAGLVVAALLAHCRQQGKTLITVTHNRRLLPLFDRVLHMADGRLETVTLAEAALKHHAAVE